VRTIRPFLPFVALACACGHAGATRGALAEASRLPRDSAERLARKLDAVSRADAMATGRG